MAHAEGCLSRFPAPLGDYLARMSGTAANPVLAGARRWLVSTAREIWLWPLSVKGSLVANAGLALLAALAR